MCYTICYREYKLTKTRAQFCTCRIYFSRKKNIYKDKKKEYLKSISIFSSFSKNIDSFKENIYRFFTYKICIIQYLYKLIYFLFYDIVQNIF